MSEKLYPSTCSSKNSKKSFSVRLYQSLTVLEDLKKNLFFNCGASGPATVRHTKHSSQSETKWLKKNEELQWSKVKTLTWPKCCWILQWKRVVQNPSTAMWDWWGHTEGWQLLVLPNMHPLPLWDLIINSLCAVVSSPGPQTRFNGN